MLGNEPGYFQMFLTTEPALQQPQAQLLKTVGWDSTWCHETELKGKNLAKKKKNHNNSSNWERVSSF